MTHVGFRARVKIASRIVSYRITEACVSSKFGLARHARHAAEHASPVFATPFPYIAYQYVVTYMIIIFFLLVKTTNNKRRR